MKTTRMRRPWLVAVSIALLLISLYVLSTGPVSWLYNHSYISLETSAWIGNTLYPPLRWCTDHSESFRKLLAWYTSLWI